MNQKTIFFVTLAAKLIGLCSVVLAYLLDGVVGDSFAAFFYSYWMYTIIGLTIFTINYEKMKRSDGDGDFFIYPINLFIPLVNIFALLIISAIALESDEKENNNKRKVSLKEKNKMTKKYPQLNSLNSLKEIYDIIFISSLVKVEDKTKKPISEEELKQMITLLKNNYQKNEYAQLLMDYEISFIKLLSIFEECLNINEFILDEVLLSSRELLKQFTNKVQETRENIEKNELMEIEKKRKINIQTKDKAKERFLKEINDEIRFHEKE